MALMSFREANYVKRVGVRPGHDGTQVYGEGGVGSGGTIDIYTVGVGVTLHITVLTLSSALAADAAVSSNIRIVTNLGVFVANIIVHYFEKAGQQTNVLFPTFPIEVPATYMVRVTSGAGGPRAYGTVWGWTEPD